MMWENEEKKYFLRCVLHCTTINQEAFKAKPGLLNILKVFKQV